MSDQTLRKIFKLRAINILEGRESKTKKSISVSSANGWQRGNVLVFYDNVENQFRRAESVSQEFIPFTAPVDCFGVYLDSFVLCLID